MAASPEAYSGLLVTEGLAKLYGDSQELADIYEADGYVAQATLLRRAFEKLVSELNQIARAIALVAREEIRTAERESRVRQDTEGEGDTRLEEFIGISDPLPSLPGSVGVNDEEALADSPVSWWWTNEEGYSGFVGREIVGYFFNAGSGAGFIPSSHLFRQQEIFRPYSSGFSGIIENPIPPRRFVEHGFERAEAQWHARVQRAKQDFLDEFARIDGQTRRPIPSIP